MMSLSSKQPSKKAETHSILPKQPSKKAEAHSRPPKQPLGVYFQQQSMTHSHPREGESDYHSGFLPWTLNFAPASAISPPRGSWWGLEPRLRRLLWATLNLHQGFFEGKKIATMKYTKTKTLTHHGKIHTAMKITRILNTIIAPWNISPFIVLTSTKIRIIFHISNCFADFLHL